MKQFGDFWLDQHELRNKQQISFIAVQSIIKCDEIRSSHLYTPVLLSTHLLLYSIVSTIPDQSQSLLPRFPISLSL